ncbi:MAG: hypothetical protein EOP61_01945 [Sphingomonadales bacterium]|nr:MAG: hypothetical protein EOP61_01945 [Sphingomonadales bacterium]
MDDAQFSNIDRKLFDRLHRGSLDPIAFHLADGRTLRGQVIEIRRFGAAGNVVGALAGEIRLAGDSGEISVSYAQIDHLE